MLPDIQTHTDTTETTETRNGEHFSKLQPNERDVTTISSNDKGNKPDMLIKQRRHIFLWSVISLANTNMERSFPWPSLHYRDITLLVHSLSRKENIVVQCGYINELVLPQR